MAKVTVHLVGHQRLNKKLRALKGPKAKKIIRQASRTALKPLSSRIRTNAPVDEGVLRKSFRVRSLKRSRVRFGSRITTVTKHFPGIFYGGFVELGTDKMEPKRFIRDTVDRKRRRVLINYRNDIRRGITKLAKSP